MQAKELTQGFTRQIKALYVYWYRAVGSECFPRACQSGMNGVKPAEISPADTCTGPALLLESDSEFWHGGEQGEWCEHNGLVEDCEIAVCQGKTRGQLWAPIAERVGRDSWKEAPCAERRRGRAADSQLTPVSIGLAFWPARSPASFLYHHFFTHVSKFS